MRIIAGTARGITLNSPKGNTIRPTLDRVRESLFNILGPNIEGAKFLDLFAGTGANGLEATSRGAALSVFIEEDAGHIALIQKNAEKTRLSSQTKILKLNLLKDLEKVDGKFDIVFADPPYEYTEYAELLARLEECGLLNEGAQVIIEHDRRSSLPETAGNLEQFRQKKYGDTLLSFYA